MVRCFFLESFIKKSNFHNENVYQSHWVWMYVYAFRSHIRIKSYNMPTWKGFRKSYRCKFWNINSKFSENSLLVLLDTKFLSLFNRLWNVFSNLKFCNNMSTSNCNLKRVKQQFLWASNFGYSIEFSTLSSIRLFYLLFLYPKLTLQITRPQSRKEYTRFLEVYFGSLCSYLTTFHCLPPEYNISNSKSKYI